VLLPLLASCLEGLPNLHTFHIYHAPVDLTSFIQQAFEDVVLKSINTVVVPDYCHEILRSCPNVIKVQSTDGTGSKLVGAIMDCCPHVKTLIGINVSGTVVKREPSAAILSTSSNSPTVRLGLVKAAPNLRILHLKYPPVVCVSLLACPSSIAQRPLIERPRPPRPPQETRGPQSRYGSQPFPAHGGAKRKC